MEPLAPQQPKTIRDLWTELSYSHCIVSGPTGCGKSTVVRTLAELQRRQVEKAGRRVEILYVDGHGLQPGGAPWSVPVPPASEPAYLSQVPARIAIFDEVYAGIPIVGDLEGLFSRRGLYVYIVGQALLDGLLSPLGDALLTASARESHARDSLSLVTAGHGAQGERDRERAFHVVRGDRAYSLPMLKELAERFGISARDPYEDLRPSAGRWAQRVVN